MRYLLSSWNEPYISLPSSVNHGILQLPRQGDVPLSKCKTSSRQTFWSISSYYAAYISLFKLVSPNMSYSALSYNFKNIVNTIPDSAIAVKRSINSLDYSHEKGFAVKSHLILCLWYSTKILVLIKHYLPFMFFDHLTELPIIFEKNRKLKLIPNSYNISQVAFFSCFPWN